MNYVDFFVNLGFDFKDDLKSKDFVIEKNEELTEKIKKDVFYYQNHFNQTASFYIVTKIVLSDEKKINDIRKSVWNKNNADILFLCDENEIKMLYGKCNPQKITIKECEIDTFSTTSKDDEKLEKIKRKQIDSGAFWLKYSEIWDKAKRYSRIDKDLIETLKDLKNKLNNELKESISDEKELIENVQALIDRTLYIKYLEDNHIINSYFCKHYFKDESFDYKRLLEIGDGEEINKLFKIIHKIFSNKLFERPTIEPKYLTKEVCGLIANSFSSEYDGQFRLFDFQFDVLPIEFISYIYEVFLTEEQPSNGIYYTPKKLAELIVDDTIKDDKIGSVLDPACGSGMFLIVAVRKLFNITEKETLEKQDDIDKIENRAKLLKENIFGIEKQPIAHRLTWVSLSLQIFDGIEPDKIREFIEQELKEKGEITFFSKYDFYENILCQNTLDVKDLPFKDHKFDYIVGNPPFFEIKGDNEEISFLNNYKVNEKEFARDVVGTHQISQCFLLKIKDWAKENTRFGFVSNSSSFCNDNSISFQKYFYTNYGIEKIYELSKVKKILFENANEDVIVIIFNNQFVCNNIEYYPVEMGLFSEKPFELLIIQEDKVVFIEQKKLQNQTLRLRDYLVGSEYDLDLINKLFYKKNNLNNFVSLCNVGIGITSKQVIAKYNEINLETYEQSSDKQKKAYNKLFKENFISTEKNEIFSVPYLDYYDIGTYISTSKKFLRLNDIENKLFRRNKEIKFFQGNKLLCRRVSKKVNEINFIPSYFDDKITAFTDSVFVLRLKDDNMYHFLNAIINSNLVVYLLNLNLIHRYNSSWSKINKNALLNIPIPKDLDEYLVHQISEISKDLTEGKYEYSEKEEELNELIFDLYDLSYTERQRIRDYFLKENKITTNDLKLYEETLIESMQMFFKNPIQIETYLGFNLVVVKIILNKEYLEDDSPTAKKTFLYTLNEIFEQTHNGSFLLGQEKIFGKYCVYIIKKDINTNWTETKAFEDKQDILKRLIN